MKLFSERFDFIYKKFAEQAAKEGEPDSKLAFARFMGVSQGRMQAWEKGQLPRADDLKTMHDKMGFSYAWLIAGQGEPFEETETRVDQAEYEQLKARVTELEAELREADRINRKLTARLLIDGIGDNAAVPATGKAEGGHG